MIGLLATARTPDAPPFVAGQGLRDALLPTLPRLAVRTVNPGTAASAWAELTELQAAEPLIRNRLVEVIYEPGVYHNIGVGQGMAYTRSTTGDPADVIVQGDVTTGGILHWFGAPTWLRGITLRSLPSTDEGPGAKYPLHMTGSGVLTLIDCNLEARNPGSDGGPAILGMDGGDGLYVSFVGCHLSNLGRYPTNIHGGNTGPIGQQIAFYDCTISGADRTTIAYSGDNNEHTDMYWIGGNITPGQHAGDVIDHYDNWPAPVTGFPPDLLLAYGIA